MKLDSRFRVAFAFCLFVLFVIGCKSGSSSGPTESGDKTTTTTSGSSTVPVAPPDVAGNYNIVGTNPNGAVYRGTLEVIKHGDVYQFRWKAGTQYDGVGVQNGDVVAVAFASGANGQGCGVVDYVITRDGTLDGKWGFWGVNEAGTERATRLSGSGLEGEYDGTGRNPDGKEYKVKISVEADGDLYKFSWSNNSEGIGIRRDDNVAIGIGGSRCGFVTYEIKSDGSLEGIWGGYGTNKTGTEKATKQ
jgi:hypothetical protein